MKTFSNLEQTLKMKNFERIFRENFAQNENRVQ